MKEDSQAGKVSAIEQTHCGHLSVCRAGPEISFPGLALRLHVCLHAGIGQEKALTGILRPQCLQQQHVKTKTKLSSHQGRLFKTGDLTCNHKGTKQALNTGIPTVGK